MPSAICQISIQPHAVIACGDPHNTRQALRHIHEYTTSLLLPYACMHCSHMEVAGSQDCAQQTKMHSQVALNP